MLWFQTMITTPAICDDYAYTENMREQQLRIFQYTLYIQFLYNKWSSVWNLLRTSVLTSIKWKTSYYISITAENPIPAILSTWNWNLPWQGIFSFQDHSLCSIINRQSTLLTFSRVKFEEMLRPWKEPLCCSEGPPRVSREKIPLSPTVRFRGDVLRSCSLSTRPSDSSATSYRDTDAISDSPGERRVTRTV